MSLSDDDVQAIVGHLWAERFVDVARADRLSQFVAGTTGLPSLPAGASREVKGLARLAVKNVMRLVVDAFAQNLTVTGYRSPSALDNDAAMWGLWQGHHLDARQAQVYRPALTFGTGYVAVLPVTEDDEATDEDDSGVTITPHSPKTLVAAYRHPGRDQWPQYALQVWTERTSAGPMLVGRLIDDEATYDVVLRAPSRYANSRAPLSDKVQVAEIGDPVAHGAGVCPVVRFAYATDDEGHSRGEVEPLITDQLAINAVNFDRLIVSRFGAFPQRYVIGWTADKATLARASSMRVWGFEDENVKAGSFAAAAVEPYNSILEEMLGHVALEAQIPVATITGSIANLSAEALAMAEAPHQRKLSSIRESFGESWEQVLGIAARMSGLPAVDPGAEVVWKDTQARSFAAVVDGLVKLAQAGVPMSVLLEQVPGFTQQQVDAARSEMDRTASQAMVTALTGLAAARGVTQAAPVAQIGT